VKKLTRRDLFKAAPIAGAAAAAGALGFRPAAEARVTTRGVCRFCLLHCGIEVTTEGSRVVRVQGDLQSRTRGFICQHGYALPEVVHAPERVRTPLLRRGERLVPVTWSDALAFVAARLEQVKQRWGPEALMVQTGWPLVRHPLVGLLHRFCRAFGSPNLVSVASLCEASLRMGQALTAGSKYPHDLQPDRTLVLWGANPSRAAPALTHALHRSAEARRLFVVDPTRTDLARRAAEHLQVRPGSDGALALGLAHLLISQARYDAAFVAEHVSGFDAFARYAEDFPPQRVAALTSVGVEQLERVARRFGSEGPVHIWQGLGVEQHVHGVQTVRALVALEALTGAFDEAWAKRQLTPPGPRFGDEPLPALYRMATPEPVPPPVKAKPVGYDELPLFEVYNREAQGNLFSRAVLEGKPYPVRALVLVASNPVTTAPGGARLLEAMRGLELLVSIDPFLTASGRLADVVLPASTFAEGPMVDEERGAARRNDDADTRVTQALVQAQHDAWPDWKIVFELSRALGLGAYFPWASLREALQAKHVPYMEDAAHQPRPRVASSARFSTPTGKVELVSTVLEDFGYPGLPEWKPPEPAPNAEYPLLLVSGPREAGFINSQFRGAPSIRAKVPEPVLRVHPSRGFESGARVALVTEHGRLELKVVVDPAVHPDAVVAPGGWDVASVNAVTSAELLDPISGFPAVRSTRCRLEACRLETCSQR